MQVFIKKDYEEMSRKAAEVVAEEMGKKKDHFVLGLATGSTPVGLYKELIHMHQDEGLDFSQVVTFNLDESCTIAKIESYIQQIIGLIEEQLGNAP